MTPRFRSSLPPILWGAPFVLSACGFSALDGLTSGGSNDENTGGVTQRDSQAPSDARHTDRTLDEPAESAGETGGNDDASAPDDGGADAGDASEDTSAGAFQDESHGCPPEHFGSTCQACTCVHGKCNEGLAGTGACFCELGWAGTSCDSASTLTSSLGLYWKFDDTSGTLAMDSSGNDLNGSYVTATSVFPAPAPGAVPPSMTSWDPASLSIKWRQAVQIASSAPAFALVRSANNFTISLWYRAGFADLGAWGSELVSLGDHYILRLGKDGNPVTSYSLQFNKNYAGSSYVQCQNQVPVGAGVPSFLDGGWHHVAALSSSAPPGMAIYLDGTLVPCTKFANSAFATSDITYVGLGQDFWVGRHGNDKTSYDFQGNLDELRFFNRVLSEAEIQALAHGAQ